MGAPSALDDVGGGNLGGCENVREGGGDKFGDGVDIGFRGEDKIEACLAAEGGEVDDVVRMVARVFGKAVLDGVNRVHFEMLGVGLAESHVVLGEDVAVRQALDGGDAEVGGANLRVVQVEGFDVSFTLANTSGVDAEEVVQVYVSRPLSHIERPEKELKAFKRVVLKGGESQKVTVPVRRTDLCHWDEAAQTWMLEPGTITLKVGGSSDNLPLSAEVVI